MNIHRKVLGSAVVMIVLAGCGVGIPNASPSAAVQPLDDVLSAEQRADIERAQTITLSSLTREQVLESFDQTSPSSEQRQRLVEGLNAHETLSSQSSLSADASLALAIASTPLGNFNNYLRDELRDNRYGQFDWFYDGCSNPFKDMTSIYYNGLFIRACRHHDFGYANFANLGLSDNNNRKLVDSRFYTDMLGNCNDMFTRGTNARTACDAAATAYYIAVDLFGGTQGGFFKKKYFPRVSARPANEDIVWIKCADEGKRCNLPTYRATIPAQVRFGTNGWSHVSFKAVEIGIWCDNNTFGGMDPYFGAKRSCEYATSQPKPRR